jgi:hypothetical protein
MKEIKWSIWPLYYWGVKDALRFNYKSHGQEMDKPREDEAVVIEAAAPKEGSEG